MGGKRFGQNRDNQRFPKRYKYTSCYAHKGFRVSKRCDRATARLRKIFQRLRKIWVFERKKTQFIKILPFLGPFVFFVVDVLDHFVCAKLPGRNFGRAKKFAFRKSGFEMPYT